MTEEQKVTEYTVQVLRRVTFAGDTEDAKGYDGWQDLATVTVPARSPRKRVIREALEKSGLRPLVDSEALRVRVLDGPSSKVTEVPVVRSEPKWAI
jgi:hypothetical protein